VNFDTCCKCQVLILNVAKEKAHTKSRNVLLFEFSSEMSLDEGSLKVRLEVDLPLVLNTRRQADLSCTTISYQDELEGCLRFGHD